MPLVPCRLAQVVIDETSDRQSVIIEERAPPRRRLQIIIGIMEAMAIMRAMRGEQTQRPLTHDLLAAVLDATHHRLGAVRIVELRQQTFFAELELVAPDGTARVLDCRPSDALALLARQPDTPLLVDELVLAEAAA